MIFPLKQRYSANRGVSLFLCGKRGFLSETERENIKKIPKAY